MHLRSAWYFGFLAMGPGRVYVFGASNGGGMAYRVGIELASRVFAIGVRSGLMPVQSECPAPSRPLSVSIAHGTADQISPYAGGKVRNWFLHGRGSGHGAEQSVAIWRNLAGLPETAAAHRFPHLRPDDQTSATRYVWGANPTGTQVEFLRIDGGGMLGQPGKASFPGCCANFSATSTMTSTRPGKPGRFLKPNGTPACIDPSGANPG